MKTLAHAGFLTTFVLGCLLTSAPPAFGAPYQEGASPVAVLLSRASTLELRGRLDLARQDWTQVLVLEPNQPEALAGLVRAARAEGRTADAEALLTRLRTAHPNDLALARLEKQGKGRDAGAELRDAESLARGGDNRGAMVIYHNLYGVTPPPGAPAIAFYETEAGTPDGRPEAIAGLRALADRYPGQPLYAVALGRVLLRSPRTAAEGRTLLESYPADPEAVAALRGQVLPPATAIASADGSRAVRPPAVQRSRQESAGSAVEAPSTLIGQSRAPHEGVITTPVSGARPAHRPALTARDQGGFSALDDHRYPEAERVFQSVLAQNPRDARALAGMGYVEVRRGDLRAAVLSFERAQENGDRSLALTRALVDAQFQLSLQRAAAEAQAGDVQAAVAGYRTALQERSADPGALDGLGQVLLASGQPAGAVPVFRQLTEVRPMSPSAWKGLVLAQTRAGQGREAVATSARIPADAKAPLLADASFQQALAQAKGGVAPVQVARAEPAPVVTVTAPRSVQGPRPQESATLSAPRTQPSPAVMSAAPRSAPTESARVAPPALPRRSRGSRRATATATVRTPEPPPSSPLPVAVPVPAAAPRRDAVIADERIAQADDLLQRGEYMRAAGLYRDALTHEPQRTAAWRGLVLSLHAAGRDPEAAAVLTTLPTDIRPTLDGDATLQATVGAILTGAGRPNEALRAYARAQEIYAAQHLLPPLDLVLRVATLLASRGDDPNLYQQLIYLGNRTDMSNDQRRGVQMIWTEWAVRRARLLAVSGEKRRAVVILNAAAEAFGSNARVLNAVADGYAGVGLPREAVALYKVQDLSQAPAREIETAVAAAVAARDKRAAEQWIRLGRERFPNDPEMLTAAAEMEQARGHQDRAAELSRAAKTLTPAQDPGRVLTAELREATIGSLSQTGTTGRLATLLAPDDAAALRSAGGRPFLPSAAPSPAAPALPVPVLLGYESASR